jgi:alkylation response protein AidB-like acyl-CoA dehydrogenase
VPEEYGGAGVQSAVTHALIAEELAYGDGGLALYVIGSTLAGLAVLIAGTTEQHNALLPRCCADAGAGAPGALGWSEPASGFVVRETTTLLGQGASPGTLEVSGTKRRCAWQDRWPARRHSARDGDARPRGAAPGRAAR